MLKALQLGSLLHCVVNCPSALSEAEAAEKPWAEV